MTNHNVASLIIDGLKTIGIDSALLFAGGTKR